MPSDATSRDQVYWTAWQAFSSGAFKNAEVLARELLVAHPTDVPGRILLGQILERSGNREAAIASYERAEALCPGEAAPFTRRSILRFRAAFGEPILPRANMSDSPAVSMTSLGENGRFGNQLLQYAFIRLYAQEHGLIAEVPDWIGRDLFDLDDPFPSRKFPRINDNQRDLMTALNDPSATVLSNCDLSGYFCGATRLWRDRREQIRALVRPGRKLAPLLDRAMTVVEQKGRTLVAVHLRRGDLGYGRYWIAPAHWYVKWLDGIWGDLDTPVLYIASDDPHAAREFAKFAPLNANSLGVDIPGADFYLDHYVLSRARHLAIANSTFSFTAAMLNRDAGSFVRPDPNRRCIVPFDPWDANVFIDPEHDDALSKNDQDIIRRVVRPHGLVVYVGEYCSPWVNVARSTHPYLKVIETSDTEIDCLRAGRDIDQINDIVVERPEDVTGVLVGGRESLRFARIDSIHFYVGEPATAAQTLARLSAEGFSIFRISTESKLQSVPLGGVIKSGKHLALQRRLLPLFLGPTSGGSNLSQLCGEFGIRARGVLHIGAHEGQEIAIYEALKVPRIFFAEANPAVYGRLVKAMAGRPHVTCINRAICDRTGPVELHLASDQSSSLFPLFRHRLVYPQILPVGSVEVDGTTLDALIENLKLSCADFNLLNIHVGGAEALVLKGAPQLLRYIEAIHVEVFFTELYEGCAQIEDIEGVLQQLGFRRAALVSAQDPNRADAFYVRAR